MERLVSLRFTDPGGTQHLSEYSVRRPRTRPPKPEFACRSKLTRFDLWVHQDRSRHFFSTTIDISVSHDQVRHGVPSSMMGRSARPAGEQRLEEQVCTTGVLQSRIESGERPDYSVRILVLSTNRPLAWYIGLSRLLDRDRYEVGQGRSSSVAGRLLCWCFSCTGRASRTSHGPKKSVTAGEWEEWFGPNKIIPRTFEKSNVGQQIRSPRFVVRSTERE